MRTGIFLKNEDTRVTSYIGLLARNLLLTNTCSSYVNMTLMFHRSLMYGKIISDKFPISHDKNKSDCIPKFKYNWHIYNCIILPLHWLIIVFSYTSHNEVNKSEK